MYGLLVNLYKSRWLTGPIWLWYETECSCVKLNQGLSYLPKLLTVLSFLPASPGVGLCQWRSSQSWKLCFPQWVSWPIRAQSSQHEGRTQAWTLSSRALICGKEFEPLWGSSSWHWSGVSWAFEEGCPAEGHPQHSPAPAGNACRGA